jgi:hypothetical protein
MKKTYVKPQIKKVRLAPQEAVLTFCKNTGTSTKNAGRSCRSAGSSCVNNAVGS